MDYIFERCQEVLATNVETEYCLLVNAGGKKAAVYINSKPPLALVDGSSELIVLHNVQGLNVKIKCE